MQVSIAVQGGAHGVHQIAEHCIAVGGAHRFINAGPRFEQVQLTIVSEGPVTVLEFTLKREGVGQANLTGIGLANAANGDLALNRVSLHHPCNVGLGTGPAFMECLYAPAFVKGDSPAILVGPGATAGQFGEAKTKIGWDIGTHSQKSTDRKSP